MYLKCKRRSRYTYSSSVPGEEGPTAERGGFLRKAAVLSMLVLVLAFLLYAMCYLKELSSQIAVSDASDIVTAQTNRVIAAIMQESGYDGDYFVSFEKNAEGDVTAVSGNMARINALSARILENVVGATESRTLTVEIPLGNLTGLSLLMGRGPGVPVQIITLTSSRVEFQNNIVTAGINQTKHQILLDVDVYVSILLPTFTTYTKVSNQIAVAETVIVGSVPESYTYFSTAPDEIQEYAEDYIMNNG